MDTLAVRLTIPPVGFVGDFHSLVSAPCRAHEPEKAAPEKGGGLLVSAHNSSGLSNPRSEAHAAGIVRRGLAEVTGERPANVRDRSVVTRWRTTATTHGRVYPGRATVI